MCNRSSIKYMIYIQPPCSRPLHSNASTGGICVIFGIACVSAVKEYMRSCLNHLGNALEDLHTGLFYFLIRPFDYLHLKRTHLLQHSTISTDRRYSIGISASGKVQRCWREYSPPFFLSISLFLYSPLVCFFSALSASMPASVLNLSGPFHHLH
jgi:hypothetical protein